jgi:hypothetical protein
VRGREREREREERESRNCGYARTEVCEQTDLWRRTGTSEGEMVNLTLIGGGFKR